MEMPKTGKMWIPYGKHEIVQNTLFKSGFTWSDNKGNPHQIPINVPSIIWDENKKLSWCWFNDYVTFSKQPETEINFSDYFTEVESGIK